MPNALYYGDNLDVLRYSVASESVDLVYLDPPFNSNATYNVLFKSPAGTGSQAQIEAFMDTWQWGQEAEGSFDEILRYGNSSAADLIRAFRSVLGESDMMAYLVMLTLRLLELHRILKPTGSLYLHCDSSASHYIKLVLDSIFVHGGFKNEIVWQRSHAHSDSKQGAKHYGRVSDAILFYTKSDAIPSIHNLSPMTKPTSHATTGMPTRTDGAGAWITSKGQVAQKTATRFMRSWASPRLALQGSRDAGSRSQGAYRPAKARPGTAIQALP